MCAQFSDKPLHLHERALCQALEGVIHELLMVDPGDYIAFIRTDKINNIRDIVHSSTELYFAQGTLVCGYNMDYQLSWNGAPHISIGMMLHHSDLRIGFSLYLGETQPRVKIHRIESIPSAAAQELDLARFKDMLTQIRQTGFSPPHPDISARWAQDMPRPDKIN